MGDYGGGGMFLAFGIVCGVLEARSSGKGQVLDVAMVDGTAVLMSAIWGFAQSGIWKEEPGVNMLDTGRAYYDTYATKDGKWISLGAIEDQFFAEFLHRVGFDPADFPNRTEREAWPEQHKRFTELFLTKTRDEWCEILEGTDVCFAPVLPMSEAKQPSAHRGERDDRRRERVEPACARAALLAHARRDPGPGGGGRRAHRRDARRLRVHQRGDRRVARVGRGRADLTSSLAAAQDTCAVGRSLLAAICNVSVPSRNLLPTARSTQRRGPLRLRSSGRSGRRRRR